MKVIIIYNPNSTGDSAANAKELAQQLKEHSVDVTLKKQRTLATVKSLRQSMLTKIKKLFLYLRVATVAITKL